MALNALLNRTRHLYIRTETLDDATLYYLATIVGLLASAEIIVDIIYAILTSIAEVGSLSPWHHRTTTRYSYTTDMMDLTTPFVIHTITNVISGARYTNTKDNDNNMPKTRYWLANLPAPSNAPEPGSWCRKLNKSSHSATSADAAGLLYWLSTHIYTASFSTGSLRASTISVW